MLGTSNRGAGVEMDSLDLLLRALMAEQGINKALPATLAEKRKLLRSLMNTRPPGQIAPQILAWQDQELQRQRLAKGDVTIDDLPQNTCNPRIRLWKGDITRLAAGAIVNAANSQMLGCFAPLHNCIDNVIHSAAGMQLREECATLMQGSNLPSGQARITNAYNLPAQYVIHTAGPIVDNGHVTARARVDLAACYHSCLELAAARKLTSLAFCCISTGVYGFPQKEAAEIAVNTVTNFIAHHTWPELVIFDVFTDLDFSIYSKLLAYERIYPKSQKGEGAAYSG